MRRVRSKITVRPLPVGLGTNGAASAVVALHRGGLEVPAGAKLVEIDPHVRSCQWTGVDPAAQLTAEATVKAMQIHQGERTALAAVPPSLLTH